MADSDARYGTLAAFVDDLQARGRFTFVRTEASAALETSSLMLKKAVKRLALKRRIVVPKRRFHGIVPIEYRSAGAPLPSWLIDNDPCTCGNGKKFEKRRGR